MNQLDSMTWALRSLEPRAHAFLVLSEMEPAMALQPCFKMVDDGSVYFAFVVGDRTRIRELPLSGPVQAVDGRAVLDVGGRPVTVEPLTLALGLKHGLADPVDFTDASDPVQQEVYLGQFYQREDPFGIDR